LRDRRPDILFERHIFSRRTERRFDAAHPGDQRLGRRLRSAGGSPIRAAGGGNRLRSARCARERLLGSRPGHGIQCRSGRVPRGRRDGVADEPRKPFGVLRLIGLGEPDRDISYRSRFGVSSSSVPAVGANMVLRASGAGAKKPRWRDPGFHKRTDRVSDLEKRRGHFPLIFSRPIGFRGSRGPTFLVGPSSHLTLRWRKGDSNLYGAFPVK
jgi:hypothetical protein